MPFGKALFTVVSLCATICAFGASHYWYRSSKPNPQSFPQPEASVSDNAELYVLLAEAELGAIRASLLETAALNATAAKWSAWAAGLGGFAALISVFI